MSNLKTLYSLHKWIDAIFFNESANQEYNYKYTIPFLIVGSKRDLIPDSKFPKLKGYVQAFLNNLFQSQKGENIVITSNLQMKKNDFKYKFDEMYFDLFLGQLALEYELF